MSNHPSRTVREFLAIAPPGMNMRMAIQLAYLEGGRDVLRDLDAAMCGLSTNGRSRCRLPAGHAAAHEIGEPGVLEAEIAMQHMRFGWWPGHDLSPLRAIEEDA